MPILVALAFLLVGVLFIAFNRPIGRYFAEGQAPLNRFAKRWGFSFGDPSIVGLAQFSVFLIGLAMVAFAVLGLVLSAVAPNEATMASTAEFPKSGNN